MSFPLVSVIVPMYNVEKYIIKCVDSIIKQTLSNIEIVIINDGSIDRSLNVVRENFLDDKRVTCISQNNQGLSCARNLGLMHSKGDYIAFIDGDDWIDSNMLQEMYECALRNDSDVVCCRLQYENVENGTSCISGRSYRTHEVIGDALIKDVLLGRNIQTSAAIKLYRNSWLRKNELHFMPGIINEDVVFVLEMAFYANKVTLINKSYYHAVERNSSITRDFSEKNIDNILYVLDIQKEFLLNHNIYNKFKNVYKASYVRQLCFIIFQAAQRLDWENFLFLIQKLRRNSKFSLDLSYAVLRYLPIKLLGCILVSKKIFLCYKTVRWLNTIGLKMH